MTNSSLLTPAPGPQDILSAYQIDVLVEGIDAVLDFYAPAKRENWPVDGDLKTIQRHDAALRAYIAALEQVRDYPDPPCCPACEEPVEVVTEIGDWATPNKQTYICKGTHSALYPDSPTRMRWTYREVVVAGARRQLTALGWPPQGEPR